jgi:opacity protein-like surface antigen
MPNLRMPPQSLRTPHGRGILWAAVFATLAFDPLSAKDVTRLWYSGGGVAFHSTQDTVSSNASETGDPRPDGFATRRLGIQDTGSFDLIAGFGLTPWLSLQLDAGLFRGDVGAIDVYLEDTFPRSLDPSRPETLNVTAHRQNTVPITVGRITEIPVGITGIVRFRRDRPINPYLGAGAGMVFAGIDGEQDIDALNNRLASLRIKGETDETDHNIVPARYEALRAQGRIPFTYPISVDVQDGFEWHLVAGMEYFFADRASLIAGIRYTFALPAVAVNLEGEDQVNVSIFSEKLFRPDGSLRLFETTGLAPNPLVDPNDPTKGTVRCTLNTVGDFDHDGHSDDLCYLNIRSTRADDPVGVFLVQGGRVSLSGYNIQIGVRIYF